MRPIFVLTAAFALAGCQLLLDPDELTWPEPASGPADASEPPDASERLDASEPPDASAGADAGAPDACVPLSDSKLCESKDAQCQGIVADDGCGNLRTVVSCGTCGTGLSCVDNKCVCVRKSDAELCAAKNVDCGELPTTDNCGKPYTVPDCGSCELPETCGGDGVPGQCGCTDDKDSFCSREQAECGELTGKDKCGVLWTVDCGACQSPKACGTGSTANKCVCVPEDNAAFCARLKRECGEATGPDNCGTPRTVANCGTCVSPESCAGAGTPGQCGCTETADSLCQSKGAECGPLTATDKCGVTRTVACGACAGRSLCGAPSRPNECFEIDALNAVGGASPSEVWAAGDSDGRGVALRWDGRIWKIERVVGAPLWTVWVVSEKEVFIGGDQNLIESFDGTKWTRRTGTGTASIRSVQVHEAAAANMKWAVDDAGKLLHAKDGAFQVVYSGGTPLYSVFGFEAKAYAVGKGGMVRSYDLSASSQTQESFPGSSDLRGISGAVISLDHDMLVVDAAGVISWRNKGTWAALASQPSPPGALNSIFTAPVFATLGYCVAGDQGFAGCSWPGEGWKEFPRLTGESFRGIWRGADGSGTEYWGVTASGRAVAASALGATWKDTLP